MGCTLPAHTRCIHPHGRTGGGKSQPCCSTLPQLGGQQRIPHLPLPCSSSTRLWPKASPAQHPAQHHGAAPPPSENTPFTNSTLTKEPRSWPWPHFPFRMDYHNILFPSSSSLALCCTSIISSPSDPCLQVGVQHQQHPANRSCTASTRDGQTGRGASAASLLP